MTDNDTRIAAGVDAGTEWIKAVVVGEDQRVLGRAVAPARGFFQACVYQTFEAALDDAGRRAEDLIGVGATGFAAHCVPGATRTVTDTACHARGAFHHLGHPMTLVDIGGRHPHVIVVDDRGHREESRSVRRCAVGIGSFLMFTARHLDVDATQLQELAAAAEHPARVSSYCSVFSTTEVLERLREGVSREEIALGSMHSIAERIVEIGGFEDPVVACGGVAEFFPGVLRALESLSGRPVQVVPEPMLTGALGAALSVLQQSHDLGNRAVEAAAP